MFVSYKDQSVRLTGRWDTANAEYCETTNAGSYIEFAFEGNSALVCFDIESNREPYLHLWIELDGKAAVEATLDAYLRINAKEYGRHVCRIIYKGGEELYSRWYRPLHGKVSFRGYNADKPSYLEEDNRRIIEFVGDSITEGVLVDANYYGDGEPRYDVPFINRVYEDDACATYAWHTAKMLDLRPIIDGFGAVGVTKSGCGRVPPAQKSYPYNFDGSDITHKSDIIVINHGTNDRSKPVDLFLEKYRELLDVIRSKQPQAIIISVSMFSGYHHVEQGKMIEDYNRENGCDVRYIDTAGWIEPLPVHPLRDGHLTVARNLAPIIGKIINK